MVRALRIQYIVVSILEPEEVIGKMTRECGISNKILKQRGENGVIRGIIAELLYKYCDITQQQIGSYLGAIDYMSVSQLRRRLKEKMNQEAEFETKLQGLL
jgi:hypothetical protein